MAQCPTCHSEEVEKVSGVVSRESSVSTTEASGVGVGVHSGAMAVDTGLLMGVTRTHSLLVKMLQAPNSGCLAHLYALSLIAGAYYWICDGLPPAIPWLAASIFMAGAGVIYTSQKMAIWERLYYCGRCDIVFDPDTGRKAISRRTRPLIESIMIGGAVHALFLTVCVIAFAVAALVGGRYLATHRAAPPDARPVGIAARAKSDMLPSSNIHVVQVKTPPAGIGTMSLDDYARSVNAPGVGGGSRFSDDSAADDQTCEDYVNYVTVYDDDTASRIPGNGTAIVNDLRASWTSIESNRFDEVEDAGTVWGHAKFEREARREDAIRKALRLWRKSDAAGMTTAEQAELRAKLRARLSRPWVKEGYPALSKPVTRLIADLIALPGPAAGIITNSANNESRALLPVEPQAAHTLTAKPLHNSVRPVHARKTNHAVKPKRRRAPHAVRTHEKALRVERLPEGLKSEPTGGVGARFD